MDFNNMFEGMFSQLSGAVDDIVNKLPYEQRASFNAFYQDIMSISTSNELTREEKTRIVYEKYEQKKREWASEL